MEHNEIIGELELPKNNTEINDSTILVKGWAFSRTDKELLVDIYVDGTLRRKAKSGLPRFDVFQNYSIEQSYESGFLDSLELGENKSYNVSIMALSGEIKREDRTLIWSFYTMFFPIKIVIYQLADLVSPKQPWIDLEELRETAVLMAQDWCRLLKEYESEKQVTRNAKFSIGLPIHQYELEGLKPKEARIKMENKITSSKKRFMNKFVGRYNRKDNTFHSLCSSMGLISVKVSGNRRLVSLTNLGKEFATLKNPVFHEKKFDDALSDLETKFIYEKIIPQFKIEKKIADDVRELLKTKSSFYSKEIELVFKKYENEIVAFYYKKEIGNVTVTKKKSSEIKEFFFQPIPGSNKWSKKLNQKYIDFFVNHGNLKPNHRVLEVGSGIGRITMLLTKFLNEGEYHGLETVPRAVAYCKENISPRYPNFQFEIADVYNKAYNPEGKYKCSDYRFPYDDDTFDFVILSSVFTHLVLDDMKNYLHEISRVMKKEGHCYITYSLLNDNTLNRLKNKLTVRRYDYEFNGYRVRDKNIPENAVAYDESLVKELFGKNGLEIKSIYYGKWAGFEENLTNQDIIIAMKN